MQQAEHVVNKNRTECFSDVPSMCRKLEDLSVDEFMLSGFDSGEEDDCEDEELTQQNGKMKKPAPQKM